MIPTEIFPTLDIMVNILYLDVIRIWLCEDVSFGSVEEILRVEM